MKIKKNRQGAKRPWFSTNRRRATTADPAGCALARLRADRGRRGLGPRQWRGAEAAAQGITRRTCGLAPFASGASDKWAEPPSRSRLFPVRPILALLSLFLPMFSVSLTAGPPGPPAGPPPMVAVAPVQVKDVNPPAEYVGHAEAVQAVDLRAQVVGTIDSVRFKEGDTIRVGAPLFTIEQNIYKARLAAARAALAHAKAGHEADRATLEASNSAVEAAKANLQSAEAAFSRADKYLKRMQSADRRSIIQANLDTAESDFLESQARVAQAKAAIRQQQAQVLQAKAVVKQGAARVLQAQADVDIAEINLGYTDIRAPIAGRIGKTDATKGNYVGPASGVLARIVQLDPIRVVFSVSENDLPTIEQAVHDSGSAKSNPILSPRIRLPNGEAYPVPGHIDFVDNEVNPQTGTIAIRLLFANPDGVLLPGQYVTVLLRMSKPKTMPVVPKTAVQISKQGPYVLIVDEKHRARVRPIVLGPPVGTDWGVNQGLTGGETIIVQGVQKARPGQPVTIEKPVEQQGR